MHTNTRKQVRSRFAFLECPLFNARMNLPPSATHSYLVPPLYQSLFWSASEHGDKSNGRHRSRPSSEISGMGPVSEFALGFLLGPELVDSTAGLFDAFPQPSHLVPAFLASPELIWRQTNPNLLIVHGCSSPKVLSAIIISLCVAPLVYFLMMPRPQYCWHFILFTFIQNGFGARINRA